MARRAATAIAESLRARIQSGDFSGGQRFPPERALAAEFGVARNTVRRAIDLLGESVPLAREVGRGTFLGESNLTSLAEVARRMEGASPADMMEIRLLLEPAGAAFAATNASSAELASAREAHNRATAAITLPEFEYWDSELHHRIVSCSRNELLREMHNVLRVLRNQSAWYGMKQRSYSPERRDRYCTEHAAIVEALHRRDPEGARGAMRVHLDSVAANLLGL